MHHLFHFFLLILGWNFIHLLFCLCLSLLWDFKTSIFKAQLVVLFVKPDCGTRHPGFFIRDLASHMKLRAGESRWGLVSDRAAVFPHSTRQFILTDERITLKWSSKNGRRGRGRYPSSVSRGRTRWPWMMAPV